MSLISPDDPMLVCDSAVPLPPLSLGLVCDRLGISIMSDPSEIAAKRAWAEARAAAKTAKNVSLNWAEQLDALVRTGLADELQMVLRWCQTILPTTARGESCPTRAISDVKAGTSIQFFCLL